MTLRATPLSDREFLAQQAMIRARRRREAQERVGEHLDERTSLSAYIPAVHRTDEGTPAYPPTHLRDVVIPALLDDSLGHTVIIAPPGSAKTNTLVAYNAWMIGREPHRHFGYFSNTAGQAYRRSVAVRDLVAKSLAYRAIFPETMPDFGKGWAEGEWYLDRPDVGDKDPTMLAAGVGGAIMGARLDRATLDDIADPRNMATPYLREKASGWVRDSVMTRLTPDARATMIATRWAADDPAGWAIKQGWRLIRIKAIDEEGRSYWPERWPVWRLDCIAAGKSDHGLADPEWEYSDEAPNPPCWIVRDAEGQVVRQGRCEKATYGTRAFNLTYQGETADDESALFKRSYWQWWDPTERFPATTGGIFVDLAHEEKTSADYTVCGRVLQAGNKFLIRDVIRRRFEFPEVLALLRYLVKPYLSQTERDAVAGPILQEVLRGIERANETPWQGLPVFIEDTPGSKALIQTLKREVPGVVGWPIAGHSKLSRGNATVAYAEARNVYLPQGAPWAGDFIEELAAFPTGENDDQVDFFTMALLRFTKGGTMQAW